MAIARTFTGNPEKPRPSGGGGCQDIPLFWRLWLKAGWKEVRDPIANPERTFVFRPYFK